MKLRFDPEKDEWELPDEELSTHLTNALVKFEDNKLAKEQTRRFVATSLFSVAATAGGIFLLVNSTQLLTWLIGLIMIFYAYETTKTYIRS